MFLRIRILISCCLLVNIYSTNTKKKIVDFKYKDLIIREIDEFRKYLKNNNAQVHRESNNTYNYINENTKVLVRNNKTKPIKDFLIIKQNLPMLKVFLK